MATSTPNPALQGLNLLAMDPLPQYDAEAVVYAVLNEKDYNVKLGLLVEFILQGVEQAQIPEDVVRRQQMVDYVKSEIEKIDIPEVTVTNENLNEKVAETEVIRQFQLALNNLTQEVNALTPEGLEDVLRRNEGLQADRFMGIDAEGGTVNIRGGSENLLYVYYNPADEKPRDGSFAAPFNTIQQAINAIPLETSNSVILVMPSAGQDYPGFTVDNRVNISIFGFGCTDAHMVRIGGQVRNIGANGTRFRMADIQLRQTDAGVPAYYSEGTQGRDYFKNVTITPANANAMVVELKDVKNWIDFEDCNIDGFVDIKGEAGPSALVAMRTNNASNTKVRLESGVTLRLNSNTRFGHIQQTAGHVEINYCHSFTGVNGYAINSLGGSIALAFSNFQKADGSYLKIERAAGLEPVRIANCNISAEVGVEGPVSYQETKTIERLMSPLFELEVGPNTDGVRNIKVKRTATRGYFYEELDAQLVKVAEGTKPEDGVNSTNFALPYADKERDVEVPMGAGLTELYLVVKDTNNADMKLVFGPYDI